MIKVEFFGDSPVLGFKIKGHSDFGEEGNDIICAAVSSVAYMTANTITDVIKVEPLVLYEADGLMELKLDESSAQRCSDILDGLVLQIDSLAQEYKKYIKVKKVLK